MNTLLHFLKRPLLHIAVLSLMVNLLLLVPAIFMLQVFDRVLASQSGETLLVLLVGVGVALVLLLAFDYLRGRLQGVAGNVAAEVLLPVVARISVALGSRRSGRPVGEALRDVGALRVLFSSQGLAAMFDAPWVPVYLLVITVAHPLLGFSATLSALLLVGFAVVGDLMMRCDVEELQCAAGQASRYLDASLQNAEIVQTLGMTDALLARWRSQSATVTALQIATARRTVFFAAATRMLRQAVQVLILAVGAWLVIAGEATAGIMIATTTVLGRALAPVEQIVGSWRVLAEGRAAWKRLNELLKDDDSDAPRMPLPPPSGALTAQNLVFRAPNSERLLIAGVSLKLAAGETLAIIGASGAGKSTLMRLLTGVWQPTAGVVRLDQVDLAQWPRTEIGPHIGYVPQDVELFPGTVAENIARLGEIDADCVVEAAHRAHAHEMILSLPDGYETLVDPSGALLSPGQRQRIALARALYGDPKLLILDEPNSNLDGAGENALAATLRDLRGKVTVIVVTHRNTLIQYMDQMLVLDGGRTQDYGPAAQVMRAMQARQVGLASADAGARVVDMPAVRSQTGTHSGMMS